VYRLSFVLPAFFLLFFTFPVDAQQQPSQPSTAGKTPSYSAIPVQAAKEPNPVKPTAESLSRAKKWWALDCEMCHGKNGDGKGETAKDMKLTIADLLIPRP
jgi:hypothetical protein